MTVPAVKLEDRSQWLSSGDVCRALGITRQRVSVLAREGRLPFVDTANGRLFSADGVEAYRAGRTPARKPSEPAEAGA